MQYLQIRFRGNITIILVVTTNASFIYSLALSAAFDLRGFIFVSAILPPLFIILSYFLPESPFCLMKR